MKRGSFVVEIGCYLSLAGDNFNFDPPTGIVRDGGKTNIQGTITYNLALQLTRQAHSARLKERLTRRPRGSLAFDPLGKRACSSYST